MSGEGVVVINLQRDHAAVDPAGDGVLFVVAEIHTGARKQYICQVLADLLGRQGKVYAARLDGGAGHTVVFRAFGVLRDGDSARLPEGFCWWATYCCARM